MPKGVIEPQLPFNYIQTTFSGQAFRLAQRSNSQGAALITKGMN